ncbi:MAG: hypothetical protein RRZ68_06590, partial [Oscillospiraceae bacterium]
MAGPMGHGGRHGMVKPHNAKKTIFKLLSYLAKRKWMLLLVVALVLFSSVGMVSASYFIKVIIDDCIIPLLGTDVNVESFTPLIKTLFMMGSVFAISSVASY